MKMNKQELKKWFEANYLDGDEIQGGQMLSSEECFNAILDNQIKLLDALIEHCEGMRQEANDKYPRWNGLIGYQQCLDDQITYLQSLKKTNE